MAWLVVPLLSFSADDDTFKYVIYAPGLKIQHLRRSPARFRWKCDPFAVSILPAELRVTNCWFLAAGSRAGSSQRRSPRHPSLSPSSSTPRFDQALRSRVLASCIFRSNEVGARVGETAAWHDGPVPLSRLFVVRLCLTFFPVSLPAVQPSLLKRRSSCRLSQYAVVHAAGSHGYAWSAR